MVPSLPFSAEQLYEACLEVYHDGEHAPYQAWVDTLGDDVILIRVSFPEEFCKKCAARLEALRIVLHQNHGYAMNITYLIYTTDLEKLRIRDRSSALQGLFLTLD